MESRDITIRETGTGLEVVLHVQPRARRNEIAGVHDQALKVKISAPPVDDAANRAVVEFFSDLLDIPKTRITIISGDRSRRKTVRINGLSVPDFLSRCLPR